MIKAVESVKAWFERQAFGVCEWWGEILGLPSDNIRLFFIYTSFLTVGSPVVLYLVMAFWKKAGTLYLAQRRGSVMDL